MLITFKTPAYADITMFGDVAKALIRMMGHSGGIPGAILADDVPKALETLRGAVARHPDAPLNPRHDNEGDTPPGESVSLAKRALPLLALLEAAARDAKNVMRDEG